MEAIKSIKPFGANFGSQKQSEHGTQKKHAKCKSNHHHSEDIQERGTRGSSLFNCMRMFERQAQEQTTTIITINVPAEARLSTISNQVSAGRTLSSPSSSSCVCVHTRDHAPGMICVNNQSPNSSLKCDARACTTRCVVKCALRDANGAR